jgi:enhancing lycopene biosynthesis protein 2
VVYENFVSLYESNYVYNFSKKVAVVLSGCGVYDGSEIHEAAACMAAITRHGAQPVVFAPKMNQV